MTHCLTAWLSSLALSLWHSMKFNDLSPFGPTVLDTLGLPSHSSLQAKCCGLCRVWFSAIWSCCGCGSCSQIFLPSQDCITCVWVWRAWWGYVKVVFHFSWKTCVSWKYMVLAPCQNTSELAIQINLLGFESAAAVPDCWLPLWLSFKTIQDRSSTYKRGVKSRIPQQRSRSPLYPSSRSGSRSYRDDGDRGSRGDQVSWLSFICL